MLLRVPKFLRLCLASFSLDAGILLAADEASQPSPFLPASGGPVQPSPESSATYEFVGVTATQTQTLVSIRRLSDQRSVWIPVGQTVAEITVVGYNPTREEVTLRTPGASLTLRLRDQSPAPVTPSAGDAPRPLPAPAATMRKLAPVAVPSKPLSTQEEKEFEARMLVTDLLEIGQQQRKAYEEARREAATKTAPPPPVSTSASAPPANAADPAPAPQPSSAPDTPAK